jgi:hypothetical protein
VIQLSWCGVSLAGGLIANRQIACTPQPDFPVNNFDSNICAPAGCAGAFRGAAIWSCRRNITIVGCLQRKMREMFYQLFSNVGCSPYKLL